MSRLFEIRFVAYLVVSGAAGIGMAHAQDEWQRTPPPDSYFQLIAMGQTSFIGVNLADIDSERARTLKLRDVHGVEISRIEENSPAAKAGLKVGDVVLEYNGQRVEGMEQFGRFVRETPVGREVKLLISRDGNQTTVPVTVAARKDVLRNGDLFAGTLPGNMREFHFNMPEVTVPMHDLQEMMLDGRTAVLGVEAESLSPQLAEFFGVKEGVLVRSVIKDSPAEKAGIKAGDVITKVEQEKITSASELASAVRAARSKTTFPVQVVRERREMTLNVTVEKSSPEGRTPVRVRVVKTTPVKI
jgi:serine protease Do